MSIQRLHQRKQFQNNAMSNYNNLLLQLAYARNQRRLLRLSSNFAIARSDLSLFSSSFSFRSLSFSSANWFFSLRVFCLSSNARRRSSAAFLFRAANFSLISCMVLSRRRRATGSLTKSNIGRDRLLLVAMGECTCEDSARGSIDGVALFCF